MATYTLLSNIVEPPLFARTASVANLPLGRRIAGGAIRGYHRAGQAAVDAGKAELIIQGVIVESVNALAEIGRIENPFICCQVAGETLAAICAGFAGVVAGHTSLIASIVVVAISAGAHGSRSGSEPGG